MNLGFRRRCGWCGVQLRGWQLNLCHRCKLTLNNDIASAPCPKGSRWDAEPDRIRIEL